MSGLGKGVVSSSISKLLQLSNQKVSCVKIDPYLNFDAGTMNPIAHGEVFVTEDGGECDMDIGNYERYLNQNIPKSHNITTAQIYSSVIEAERKGVEDHFFDIVGVIYGCSDGMDDSGSRKKDPRPFTGRGG